MRYRRALLGVCAIAGFLPLAACSSGVTQTFPSGTATSARPTAQAAATQDRPPVPTAAQLDSQLKSALDRNLPDDDRIAQIEDGEAFRSSIPDLYKAIGDNPNAKYMVVDPVFDNHDGTLTATAKLDKDGTGTAVRTATIHFVSVDGRWKISRTDLCGILRSADYRTPACG